MDLPGLIFVVVVFVVGVAVVVALQARTKGPDSGTRHHDERADTTADRFYGGADRPAGPDAEDPPNG